MNREYSRCRIACSAPPTYTAAGSQRRAASGSTGPAGYVGEQNRTKYQDESTNVSIVSVSRRAGRWQRGHGTLTQSLAPARGEVPRGNSSSPLSSGSTTGSSASGTGTSPHTSQCTTGIGVPQ